MDKLVLTLDLIGQFNIFKYAFTIWHYYFIVYIILLIIAFIKMPQGEKKYYYIMGLVPYFDLIPSMTRSLVLFAVHFFITIFFLLGLIIYCHRKFKSNSLLLFGIMSLMSYPTFHIIVGFGFM